MTFRSTRQRYSFAGPRHHTPCPTRRARTSPCVNIARCSPLDLGPAPPQRWCITGWATPCPLLPDHHQGRPPPLPADLIGPLPVTELPLGPQGGHRLRSGRSPWLRAVDEEGEGRSLAHRV